MRLENYIKEDSMEVTTEMLNHFKSRTNTHINNVVINCMKLGDKHPELFSVLYKRGKEHDQSKFTEPEFMPYVWLTWKFKINGEGGKFEIPKEIQDKVEAAKLNHYSTNRHHPEFHDDPNLMSNADIAEMVCDWHAMSIELGGNTREWAEKNVDKWGFNDDSKELIFYYIRELEN